eukprot:COSAG03_NODE_20567_length_317_cov_0.706422_2_plen_53_part_01
MGTGAAAHTLPLMLAAQLLIGLRLASMAATQGPPLQPGTVDQCLQGALGPDPP